MSAAVCVTPPGLRVDAALAATMLTMRPALAHHVCQQRGFGPFGDKLLGTTLPHLVEHLSIDYLVEETNGLLPIAGTTSWLDREQGLMQVRISCAPEKVDMTVAAIIRAVTLLNSLLEQ